MSDTSYRPDDPTANGWPHRAASGEELLPPVEPPPASFILQLFVIPALIVVVLLAVWQVPKWLVRRTSVEPDQLIQRLEQGSSIARFQTAFDLANKLRDKQFERFRRDPKAANELAGILERQIDQGGESGGMANDEVQFRTWLVRALGEFEVQEGVDSLLRAAETNRDPREREVRDNAVQAIAVRAYKLHELDPPQDLAEPDLESAFARLSVDEDPLIRMQAAFALGKIGTPWALAQLESMVGDPHSDTRYNAAVGLAVHGNAKAIDTLTEMLELEDLPSVQEEKNDQARLNKRALILSNAMGAAQELSRKNPDADLAPIIAALARIAAADSEALQRARIPKVVVPQVRILHQELAKRAPAAAASADDR